LKTVQIVPSLVAHRLVAGMQVDDGEAPVAEPAKIVNRSAIALLRPEPRRRIAASISPATEGGIGAEFSGRSLR